VRLLVKKPTFSKRQRLVCPILSENHSEASASGLHQKKCLGPDCALWVELEKTGGNPLYEMVYEGCGLVSTVPWRLREDKEEPTA